MWSYRLRNIRYSNSGKVYRSAGSSSYRKTPSLIAEILRCEEPGFKVHSLSDLIARRRHGGLCMPQGCIGELTLQAWLTAVPHDCALSRDRTRSGTCLRIPCQIRGVENPAIHGQHPSGQSIFGTILASVGIVQHIYLILSVRRNGNKDANIPFTQ